MCGSKRSSTSRSILTLVVWLCGPPGSAIHVKTPLTDTNNGSVVLDICSEFIEHPYRNSNLALDQKIFVVKDATGAPIIITKDTEGLLVAYAHINGGPAAWQRINLMPIGFVGTVQDFDVKQTPDSFDSQHKRQSGSVLMTFCKSQPDGALYHTSWTVPELQWDSTERKVVGATGQVLLPSWQSAGSLSIDIDAVSISESTSDDGDRTYTLLVGTAEYQDKTGAHYLFDPDKTGDEQFTFFSLAGTAQAILQIQSGSLTDGPGAFSLFRHPGTDVGGADGPLGLRFDQIGGDLHYALQLDGLGNVAKIRRHLNPFGYTDLFVACDAGLAFYPYRHVDRKPIILFAGIDRFQDIVTSEHAVDAKHSKIVIFALSHSDALYYLEATRDLKTGEVTFMRTSSWESVPDGTTEKDHASCHPIRANVAQISAQYNAQTRASELMYLGNGQDEVRHLWKDAQQMWQEQNILIAQDPKVDQKAHKYPSFVTTIAIKDSKGNGIARFPCSLTSEYSFVLINDRSFSLDHKATFVEADGFGKLVIARRAGHELTGPQYTLGLQPDQHGVAKFSQVVEPSQRVLRILSKMKTGSAISDATNTRGQKVFDKDKDKHDFDFVAKVTADVGPMVHKVDPIVAKQVLGAPPPDLPQQGTHSWEKDAQGAVRALAASDPFLRAIESAVGDIIESGIHVLGEIFEWLRAGFKAVVKVAIKYYFGPLIRFYIKIGTKVLHFVLEHVGPVIRSITTFLDKVLGTNLTKYLDWLGFLFDPERTRKTQKVLVDATKNCLTTAQRFVNVNNQWMKDELDQLDQFLRKYVKDTRPDVPKIADSGQPSVVSTVFDFLFDNPILSVLWKYTPLAIIMEAIDEEFADDLRVPDISQFTDLVTKLVPNLVKSELDVLVKVFADVLDKLGKLFSGSVDLDQVMTDMTGDIIWTIVDALKPIILTFMAALEDMCGAVICILEGEWVIPGISEEWTDFTGTKMTLLDLVSFITAEVLNLWSVSFDDGKELFHDDPDVAKRFLIDEKYLSIGNALKRGGLDLSAGLNPTLLTTSSTRTMARSAATTPRIQAAFRAESDDPNPDAPLTPAQIAAKLAEDKKKAAKKWNMIFSVVGRSIGTASTMWEIAFTVADLKEVEEGIEMADRSAPPAVPPKVSRFQGVGNGYRSASGNIMKWSGKALGKIESVLTIGGNTLSVFSSLGSIIAITVFMFRTTMSEAMPNSGIYLFIQWTSWALFRFPTIYVQTTLRAGGAGASDWKAVPPAVLNMIGIWIVSAGAELGVDFANQTSDERADPESKKMVAAASTEIGSSFFSLLSSIFAASFKAAEQPEFLVAALITQGADFACSVSGLACVSSVIHDTGGMEDV